MSERLRLERRMVPRRVKRLFDQRGEPRDDRGAPASVMWRGEALAAHLVNLSPSGAMLSCSEISHVGESVALHLPDRPPIAGVVRWVRDGRIGIHFAARLR